MFSVIIPSLALTGLLATLFVGLFGLLEVHTEVEDWLWAQAQAQSLKKGVWETSTLAPEADLLAEWEEEFGSWGEVEEALQRPPRAHRPQPRIPLRVWPPQVPEVLPGPRELTSPVRAFRVKPRILPRV
jgi:hypothetical protein